MMSSLDHTKSLESIHVSKSERKLQTKSKSPKRVRQSSTEDQGANESLMRTSIEMSQIER